jgi:hypothetical protein
MYLTLKFLVDGGLFFNFYFSITMTYYFESTYFILFSWET